jgi:predicted ATPase/class 3 adenylate cyclase
LSFACARCGAANEPGERYCGECGGPLGVDAGPASAERSGAELRLVSVLFADLVGFTALSERRDAEEVRDLLSRYFDTCRKLIGLYGGTIEKFIGDAVMAVWGAPVAKEDDAERAVRAALDLVAAVAALGEEAGVGGLQARAGVLSGEAAVTIGAAGQGMVAGDLVNTASRIQTAAAPSAVLVGEATRRASEAAIAYVDAGSHELKGKIEPVPLWRAMRVVGGRGGALKSVGLEPPFVGRERELRMLKELFHATAEEARAHLLSVVGIAGIGKSRLSWEFFKYLDGLSETALWHRGRCLSYGEGVTYWALADMVRMRAGILEGEEPDSALAKLRSTTGEYVLDEDERRWIEPRLAHLLGLEDRSSRDPDDLFGAWRLFFERLSESQTVVMVFEDLQWADPTLLDFIEYLLDWARKHRLFILTLARPELSDRRPDWGGGKRGFTSLYLEPLPPEAMGALLAGLVPGLPDTLHAKILERAEGVPLYAVETVRMLLDRGLLVQEGGEYRVGGDVDALDVPETLHALILARLDGLTREERSLLQDAAVMGKTFSRDALTSLTALDAANIGPILASLVRKELLSTQSDPRSPERGQYGFLQDLVRRVAYDTLAKKDRKARHLAAAASLETSWGEEDEIAEVVASHLVQAFRLAPDADDAGQIRSRAQAMLVRAGERSASLGAHQQAKRYFQEAADLAGDPASRAELLERAGVAAHDISLDEAHTLFEEAVRVFDSQGQKRAAARVSARLGEVLWEQHHIDEALDRMEASFALLSGEQEDENLAFLAAQLARILYFRGNLQEGAARVDTALVIAEKLALPEVLSMALQTKALLLLSQGRPEEARALLKHALDTALEHELALPALRGYVNLSYVNAVRDRYEEALEIERSGISLARRVGHRFHESFLMAHMCTMRWVQGRWDEAFALADEMPHEGPGPRTISPALMHMHRSRGEMDQLEIVWRGQQHLAASKDVQDASAFALMSAIRANGIGEHAGALRSATEALDTHQTQGMHHPNVRYALVEAADAAFALNDLAAAERLQDMVASQPIGWAPPFLRAMALRIRARLDALQELGPAAETSFRSSAAILREIGATVNLAVVLFEHGQWLASEGRSDDASMLLAEATQTFRDLRADWWLQRLDASPAVADVVAYVDDRLAR